jgi:propanol-preferring alcohol dehydrogenase
MRHWPPLHDCPASQAFPHTPQFVSSVWRFAQYGTPPALQVVPTPQLAEQAPLEHTSPAAHPCPHAPQFCVSAPRSLHDAPQREVPPSHARLEDDEVALVDPLLLFAVMMAAVVAALVVAVFALPVRVVAVPVAPALDDAPLEGLALDVPRPEAPTRLDALFDVSPAAGGVSMGASAPADPIEVPPGSSPRFATRRPSAPLQADALSTPPHATAISPRRTQPTIRAPIATSSAGPTKRRSSVLRLRGSDLGELSAGLCGALRVCSSSPIDAPAARPQRGAMLAMELASPGRADSHPLRAVERPDPTPGPGEIRVRVAACAVCRTDLQICEGDLEAKRLPIVPGHQVVGRVDALGPGVTEWNLGDRAGIAWLAGADGTCAHCHRDHENLCVAARFTGWDRDGGYATHAVARADFALRLPSGFDDLDAAPLLCGGVIGYRSLRISGIRPGGRLGLYGFGASATLAIQVARHWGCRVFVCTRSAEERARALALGAEWAGGSEDRPPEALDAAVTFAPAGSVVAAALSALDRGGAVAINAIHLDRLPEMPYASLWWERSIRSVANFTRKDATEFLALAADIPIRPEREVHPLREANVALEALAKGRIHGAAVLECP